MDNDMKLKKHNLEAEKRLKKVEQDYLHTSQKYTETRSQWVSLHDEKIRAINRSGSAAGFINSCNNMVEKLQKVLEMLPTIETTEETIDHTLQFSMLNSQELDHETISELREINRERHYIQRKMLRSDSRKAVNDLLKEVKEKNKCRDKALSNYKTVCNSTSHDSLRKSVELEMKVLKKLIRELKKDWEGKQHIKQYATNIYKDFRQKVKYLEEKKIRLSGQWDEEKKYMQEMKHLEEKKIRLSGQWDVEKKYMQEMKKKHDRIGTYPSAEYIKMLNDNLP